jgi:hypothetical protein
MVEFQRPSIVFGRWERANVEGEGHGKRIFVGKIEGLRSFQPA